MFLLIIAIYGLLLFYELVPLYKQKLMRDFLAVSILGGFTLFAFLLLSFHIKLPSPATPIENMINSMFGK